MRHILQRGIEVVRLVGNHGMSAAMVVHLAKTFDAKVTSSASLYSVHGTRFVRLFAICQRPDLKFC